MGIAPSQEPEAIINIKEEKGETPEVTIKKAKAIVKQVCGLELDVEYGHRTGKIAENAPRTVIFKLFSRF